MEIEVQNEVEAQPAEQELSPLEHLQRLWTQQPGFALFKQRSTIALHPDLLPYANVMSLRGWASPRAFAIQGLLVSAVLISLVNWYITHDIGPRKQQIEALHAEVQSETERQQGIMDATQAEINRIQHTPRSTVWRSVSKEEALRQMYASLEDSTKSLQEFKDKAAAQEKEIYAHQQAEALVDSGTPLIFSLSLVFAAGLVAAGVRRDFPRSNVRPAGDLYLYFATAGGIWLNLVFLVLMHFVLSGSTYGLTGFSNTVGPLFWALFWVGFYVLFVRYLGSVARDMLKAMEIRPPASEWTPDNRMLLRLHNSFFIAFAMLEAMFLCAGYIFYFMMRRFA